MKSRLLAFNLVTCALLGSAVASAQQRTTLLYDYAGTEDLVRQERRLPVLEFSPRFGVASRAITGTGSGFGYGAQGTPTMGADLRLLFHAFDCGSCGFHHGVALGFTWMPGPDFGASDRYAWRHYVGDVAYAMRIEFPCMRGRGRQVFLTGLLGVTGAWADAGTGTAPEGDSDRWNERVRFASQGDHVALGWRFGANLDLHLRRFLVGVGVDIRQMFGVESDHAQTFMLGAQLRLGFDVPLGSTGSRAQVAY